MNTIKVLIAEDEPILAATLKKMVQELWPELSFLPHAENGLEAIELSLNELPHIVFLDIKMPGKTGLEVAAELTEEWPAGHPFPSIVFVTAYDEFAIQAFELSASDYLLKPATRERLEKTIHKLQAKHQTIEAKDTNDLDKIVQQLRHLMPLQMAGTNATSERLTLIRAAVGNQIRMIPIEDVIYFEASDKYITVVTGEHSSLIRSSLRELMPQLDTQQFWQIHRSVVINSRYIDTAYKDETGKVSVKMKGVANKLPVSRLYTHLFKQM